MGKTLTLRTQDYIWITNEINSLMWIFAHMIIDRLERLTGIFKMPSLAVKSLQLGNLPMPKWPVFLLMIIVILLKLKLE